MRQMKRCIALLLIFSILLPVCSCGYRDILGDEMADQIERELGIDLDVVDAQNKRALKEMGEGFKLLGKEFWEMLKGWGREIDIAFGAEYEDMMEREPEIKTEKRVIVLEADDYEGYVEELERADRDALPIVNSPFIINANGQSEYRGYMIVDKKVIAYKNITVEKPLGVMDRFGNMTSDAVETFEIEVPWKIEYTLHKHEMENKLTSSALGRLLSGMVGLQWVHTQSCACGYESVISWDVPVDDDLFKSNSASPKQNPSEYKHPAIK